MFIGKLHISSTKNTPEIILNPEGIIIIKGRWMQEYFTEFSQPAVRWLDKYINEPAEITRVDFYLEYFDRFNTAVLISLLNKILCVNLKQKKLIINWYIEDGDEDILDQGVYISTVLGIPFNFILIPDLIKV